MLASKLDLDDKFLFAMNQYDLNPVEVKVSESTARPGKYVYQLFLDNTLMAYELRAIEEQGFKMIWSTISRRFRTVDCCLEVCFLEQ